MGLLNNHIFSIILGTILLIYLFTEAYESHGQYLNKKINYYNNFKPTSEVVISQKLKNSNTLEQDMVDNMMTATVSDHPRLTPRYQPLLPNAAGAALVE